MKNAVPLHRTDGANKSQRATLSRAERSISEHFQPGSLTPRFRFQVDPIKMDGPISGGSRTATFPSRPWVPSLFPVPWRLAGSRFAEATWILAVGGGAYPASPVSST